MTPTGEPTPYATSSPGLLAPWWHTVIVVAVLLAASAGQAHTLGGEVQRHGRSLLYLSTIAFEWVIVAFIWLGVHRRGIKLRELIGGRWDKPEDALLDGALAIGFWIAAALVLAVVRYSLGLISLNNAENMGKVKELSKTLGFLIPSSGVEIALFAALALTAGFCEELIYRGYLQKQFRAMSGSLAVGVLIQGAMFGASHGYQGWKLMVTIAVYGVLFGILAAWRKSLRPGMMTHAWQDLSTGVLLKFLSQQSG